MRRRRWHTTAAAESGLYSLWRPAPDYWIDGRIVHVQNAPLAIQPTTHGHAVSLDQFARNVNGVIIRVPEGVTEHLHVMHLATVVEFWSELQIRVLQVFHYLLGAAIFAGWRVRTISGSKQSVSSAAFPILK